MNPPMTTSGDLGGTGNLEEVRINASVANNHARNVTTLIDNRDVAAAGSCACAKNYKGTLPIVGPFDDPSDTTYVQKLWSRVRPE